MKHVNIGLGALIVLGVILAVVQPPALPTQAAVEVQPTPQAKYPLQDAALREAFSTAIHGREDVLGFIVYDTEVQRIEYSEDGQTALLFLQMRDRNTGEVIATEPGLAIAQLNSLSDGSKALDWKITLQADSNWVEQLNSLPAGMLTEEGRFLYMPDATPVTDTLPTPIRGYKLPWAKGLSKPLTLSIGHFLYFYSCNETACRFAYDFADGTMFPLLAARDVSRSQTTSPIIAARSNDVSRSQTTPPSSQPVVTTSVIHTLHPTIIATRSNDVSRSFITWHKNCSRVHCEARPA